MAHFGRTPKDLSAATWGLRGLEKPFNKTPAAAATKSFTILRGLIYAAAFVWLWTWLAILVRSFDEKIPVALPLWLRSVGFVLASAGALLAGICIATFVTKGRGTPAPFDPPREFVASGPYLYVRNPMYVGATAVTLGAGLALSPHLRSLCSHLLSS